MTTKSFGQSQIGVCMNRVEAGHRQTSSLDGTLTNRKLMTYPTLDYYRSIPVSQCCILYIVLFYLHEFYKKLFLFLTNIFLVFWTRLILGITYLYLCFSEFRVIKSQWPYKTQLICFPSLSTVFLCLWYKNNHSSLFIGFCCTKRW